MSQIDLEEAIEATKRKPPTVREFSTRNSVPEWRVRKSIELGTLMANRRVRPMTVEGGEVALTVLEWQLALRPAVKQIKASQWGWSDGGKQLDIIGSDGRVRSFRQTLTKVSADMQRREIDALPCKRLEAVAP